MTTTPLSELSEDETTRATLNLGDQIARVADVMRKVLWATLGCMILLAALVVLLAIRVAQS